MLFIREAERFTSKGVLDGIHVLHRFTAPSRLVCFSGFEVFFCVAMGTKPPVLDVKLNYEDRGHKDLPVLLCLPGALGTAKSDFGFQLEDLSRDVCSRPFVHCFLIEIYIPDEGYIIRPSRLRILATTI